jgi:hypothetical protein
MIQILADPIEIRSPTVAHNRAAAMQFDAGDQGRVAATLEWYVRTERLLKHTTNLLYLLVRKWRCRHNFDRVIHCRRREATSRFR